MLKPAKVTDYAGLSLANGANYEIVMPSDYLHLLNCICIYKVKKTYKCYNAGDTWRAPAKRLTADMYSQVLDNFWNKPTYKKPYYYIHNVNSSKDEWASGSEPGTAAGKTRAAITYATVPTNQYDNSGKGTDINNLNSNHTLNGTTQSYGNDALGKNIVEGSGGPESISLKAGDTTIANASLREKGAEIRYGNRSEVRIEIRYGTDDSIFELSSVYVDYIKAPQHIRLTQEQIDRTEDSSQLLEYPDYVCQEIINELVHLIMENISDQRLQTHPVVSQSIANPAQTQTPEAAGQTA